MKKKSTLSPEQIEVLNNDIFDKPTSFDDKFKEQNKGKVVPGNARLSMGLYRTDSEKEKYRKEILERELP